MVYPSCYRITHIYHKALDPTNVPIIIDNQLFILSEQLSRHVVDTKLSCLLPYPDRNIVTNPSPENPNSFQVPPNFHQQYDIGAFNHMTMNVEQQLYLERMHAQFLIDNENSIKANSNQLFSNQPPTLSSAPQMTLHRNASTNTYYVTNDVEMKPM